MQGSWSAVATEAWQLEVHGRQLLLLMLPRPVSPPQQPDLACRYLCHVQHIACCMIQLPWDRLRYGTLQEAAMGAALVVCQAVVD